MELLDKLLSRVMITTIKAEPLKLIQTLMALMADLVNQTVEPMMLRQLPKRKKPNCSRTRLSSSAGLPPICRVNAIW